MGEPTTSPEPINTESASSTSTDENGHWELVVDSKGRTYYANSLTLQTSWDKPPGFKPKEEEILEPVVLEELADGWVKLLDPSSQNPYYANKITEVVQWHGPGEVPTPSPRSLPRYVGERRSSTSVNSSGGDDRRSSLIVPLSSRPSLTPEEVLGTSPADFYKAFDEDTQKDYWVHRESSRVILSPPPGWNSEHESSITDSPSRTTDSPRNSTPTIAISVVPDPSVVSDPSVPISSSSSSVSESSSTPSLRSVLSPQRDQMAKRYSLIIPPLKPGELEDWQRAAAIEFKGDSQDTEGADGPDGECEGEASDDENENEKHLTRPPSLPLGGGGEEKDKNDTDKSQRNSMDKQSTLTDAMPSSPLKKNRKEYRAPPTGFRSSDSSSLLASLDKSNSADKLDRVISGHTTPPPVPHHLRIRSFSGAQGPPAPMSPPPPRLQEIKSPAKTYPPPPPRSPRKDGYNTFPKASTKSTFKVHPLPTSLKNEAAKFKQAKFVEHHFRIGKLRQGLHSRKVTHEELSRWQRTLISKSLLTKSKKYTQISTELFKYILQFMGDISSTKSPTWLAKTIVSTGQKYEILRDEIYVQLCKQTQNNQSLPSRLQGWKLMALCSATFAPNKEFQEYVCVHISKYYEDSEELIGTLVPWCYWRLQKTIKDKGPEKDYSLVDIDNLIAIGIPSCSVLFGSSLDYIMQLQKLEGKTVQYPEILPVLIGAIRKMGGCQTKGIFRLAADVQHCQSLKKQLEKGDYEIRETNVLTLADVLKIWLRELYEPLIPKDNYVAALKICDEQEAILKFVASLPDCYRDTLEYLLDFLVEMSTHAKVTSMTEENLAIVFCSNLLKPMDGLSDQMALSNSTKESKFVCNLIKAWAEKTKTSS